MFDRTSSLPGSQPRGSPLTRCLTALGTASGVASSILLTPPLFNLTERWLSNYLTSIWGADLAGILVFVMGASWAVALYALTKMLMIGGLTAALVSLAARTSSSARLY